MTAPELPHAPEADAVGAPVERPVRRGLSWLACRIGLHRWWHLQVQYGDDWVDLCCACGRTRPAQD